MRCVILLLLLTPALLVGCGKKKAPDSAEGVAQAFAKAVSAGKMADAAALFDYVEEARRQNDSWDDIASGQRNLIVGKLKEDKASQLLSVFPGGSKVTVQPGGTAGVYTVTVNGKPRGALMVRQTQAGWKIVSMQ